MAQAATCACCSSRLRSPICSRPLTRNPHGANRSGLTAWISRDPPYPESRANSAAISVIVGSAVTGKWLKNTESRTAFASVIWAIINPQASMALAVLASVLIQRVRDTVAEYTKGVPVQCCRMAVVATEVGVTGFRTKSSLSIQPLTQLDFGL